MLYEPQSIDIFSVYVPVYELLRKQHRRYCNNIIQYWCVTSEVVKWMGWFPKYVVALDCFLVTNIFEEMRY